MVRSWEDLRYLEKKNINVLLGCINEKMYGI